MMLGHAGCRFSNKYIQGDEWIKLKYDKTLYPTESLPVIVVDGKRHFETMASLRSLAIRLGYYNTNNHFACYHCDCVCDITTNIYNSLGNIIAASTEKKRRKEFEKFSILIDSLLKFVEEAMQMNGW